MSTFIDGGAKTSAVERWNIKTNQIQPLTVVDVATPILLDWSPDEQYMAVGDLWSEPIWIVDTSSGHTARILAGAKTAVASWDSSGTRFATITAMGDIVIWDTANWQPITTLPSQGDFNITLKWDPESNHLAATGRDGVILWNVLTGGSQIIHHGVVRDAAWDPQTKRLATTVGDKVYIWDVTQLP